MQRFVDHLKANFYNSEESPISWTYIVPLHSVSAYLSNEYHVIKGKASSYTKCKYDDFFSTGTYWSDP